MRAIQIKIYLTVKSSALRQNFSTLSHPRHYPAPLRHIHKLFLRCPAEDADALRRSCKPVDCVKFFKHYVAVRIKRGECLCGNLAVFLCDPLSKFRTSPVNHLIPVGPCCLSSANYAVSSVTAVRLEHKAGLAFSYIIQQFDIFAVWAICLYSLYMPALTHLKEFN